MKNFARHTLTSLAVVALVLVGVPLVFTSCVPAVTEPQVPCPPPGVVQPDSSCVTAPRQPAGPTVPPKRYR